MYYTRDDLRYYWRIDVNVSYRYYDADDAFLSLYTTHAREKGKMRKRGIASSPPSSLSFFLGRLTHRKCQLRPSLSFHRSFPFTSPPSSFSSLPLSLSDISLSFSGSPSLFEGLSLSLSLSLPPFLFLVRSARESRLACRLRSTRNAIRKERTVGTDRAEREREEGVPGCAGGTWKRALWTGRYIVFLLSFPRHVPANFEFLIGQRDIHSRFFLSRRAFFSGTRAISTDSVRSFHISYLRTLWRNRSLSYRDTCIYNIEESLMEFEISNLFKERIPI